MKRTLALPSLAAALMIALAAAVAVSLTAGVPKASAYYLANGCDIYNEYNGKIYRCTPDRTTYYTPDGLNPNWVAPGTEGKAYVGDFGDFTINDNIGIPPPAPYLYYRDYCSNPNWLPAAFEGHWQVACYNHDVCYGSQKGRLLLRRWLLARHGVRLSKHVGTRTSSRSGASRRPTSGTTLFGSSAPVTTNRVRRATSPEAIR